MVKAVSAGPYEDMTFEQSWMHFLEFLCLLYDPVNVYAFSMYKLGLEKALNVIRGM